MKPDTIERYDLQEIVDAAVRFAGDAEQNYIQLSHEEVIVGFILKFLEAKGIPVSG